MSILRNRLNNIEAQNKGNIFKHEISKINRKGASIINTSPFHFKKFIFNGNLYSIKIPEEKFTNFIRSYDGNTYYEILKELFNKLYYDNYNILDDFVLDESNYSDISARAQRLKRIIMFANDIRNIEDVPKINELIPAKKLKDKEKRYKGIRLFVNVRENGYIDLYLIDLYHLGIDAFNVTTQNYNLDRNYNSNEDCKKCISRIADKYELKD